jgi:hypothetical protein
MPAWQEWIAGTDPTNGQSRLTITGLRPHGAYEAVLEWQSVSGRLDRIGRATGAVSSGFAEVAGNLAGTAASHAYTATLSGAESLYYRVEVD